MTTSICDYQIEGGKTRPRGKSLEFEPVAAGAAASGYEAIYLHCAERCQNPGGEALLRPLSQCNGGSRSSQTGGCDQTDGCDQTGCPPLWSITLHCDPP